MMRKTTEQFIHEARIIHNNLYEYDKTVYVGATSPVIITCPTHGDFAKSPNNHLSSKQGCPRCSKKHRPSTQEFITEVDNIHHYKYDYSKTVYGKNNTDKVIITCPVHGDFTISPRNHKSGHGCSACANNEKGTYHKKDTNWFIRVSKQAHNDKYDYSKVVYHRYHDKVEIICPLHGSFHQSAGSHIHNNHGCPECGKEKYIGGYGEQRFINHPEIKELPATLYLVRMYSATEEFLKIGITCKTVYDRLNKDNKVPYTFEVINTKEGKLYDVFKIEQSIKKQFSQYKYRPSKKFSGYTECFALCSKQLLMECI